MRIHYSMAQSSIEVDGGYLCFNIYFLRKLNTFRRKNCPYNGSHGIKHTMSKSITKSPLQLENDVTLNVTFTFPVYDKNIL